MITYEEFKKVEVRAGKILSAEKIPDTDKLLKLSVDFGEKVPAPALVADGLVEPVQVEGSPDVGVPELVSKPRQIVSGIAMHFPDPALLVGRTCMFVTNLEPRVIKGHESHGMLFAVSSPDGGFSILEPNSSIQPGAQAA